MLSLQFPCLTLRAVRERATHPPASSSRVNTGAAREAEWRFKHVPTHGDQRTQPRPEACHTLPSSPRLSASSLISGP